ncbi:MAG: 6-phosphofructokinase, partial [Gaiellales bacterium]
GTVLHSSRTNPRRVPEEDAPPHLGRARLARLACDDGRLDLTPVVIENLERAGVAALIAIGGDDTLGYAARLHAEGVPVTAVPKTMDNDVRGTEYCIGFSTAITRAKDAITRQRTTLGSHERIGVFRIFGRDAGFTALYTGYAASVRCVLPEHRFDLDHLCSLLLDDRRRNRRSYALVVASEGAVWEGYDVRSYGDADAYGHRKKVDIGEILADEIRDRTGVETTASDLTYDLRSGDPDSVDQIVATTYANVALDLVADGVYGQMVGVRDGRYAYTGIPDPGLGPRKVDVGRLYNKERYRPNYTGLLGSPLLLSNL